MRGVVLLLAAGRGERLGAGPKAFVELDGVPLVRRAADAAAAATLVDRIVVAVPPGYEDEAARALAGIAVPVTVVTGGETRNASAAAALREAGDVPAVAVHDAARALCPSILFDRCLAALDGCDGVIPVIPVTDTVKRVRDGAVVETLDRRELAAAQTPQAFRTAVYRRAHEAASGDVTDDASLVERIGVAVSVITGDEANVKITTRADLARASGTLRPA